MNIKYVVIAAVMAATLVETITMTTYSAIATENSQVTSQDCGNELEPLSTECQNTASQIQGNKHTVSLASQQKFEEKENTPAPTGQQGITPSIVLPH